MRRAAGEVTDWALISTLACLLDRAIEQWHEERDETSDSPKLVVHVPVD